MPSGRPPNLKRRQQMFRLRSAGFSLTEIGKELGISRQRVKQAMKLTGNIRLVPIRCRECQALITRMRMVHDNNIPVWCLACLAKHPKATFGQRLKAYRLAAGLTLAVLARRCGVAWQRLSSYEQGKHEPKWEVLAKLIREFGVGLVDVE